MADELTNDQSIGSDQEPPSLPSISLAQRRRLQGCFDHGTKLMAQDKYDHDYANTMFSECVVNDPANLVYIESFFENLNRKFEKKRRPRAKSHVKGSLKKLASKQDWLGVIREGVDLLKKNPWDVPTLRTMADACKELGLNEVELRILKSALDATPKDPEVNRHCAKSLSRMGQFDMAIACWHRVEENKLHDREASQMISQLTLEKNRVQAGFSEAPGTPAAEPSSAPTEVSPPSAPSPTRPEPPAEEPHDSKRRQIQLTPRQQLEQQITDDPSIPDNYVQLAKLLVNEKRHGEAELMLRKATSAVAGDLKVQEALEDVQISRFRIQVAIAEKRAVAEDTDEARQLENSLRAEMLQREIEVFHSRSERYPDNPVWHFELGARLKRTGRYDQAIEALRKSLDDQRRKPFALLELGECFQHQRDYQQAMKSYDQALREMGDRKSDICKLALYRAGVLSTGLKNLDEAEKYLSELSRLDSGYRDISARLDKIRQIRDKG